MHYTETAGDTRRCLHRLLDNMDGTELFLDPFGELVSLRCRILELEEDKRRMDFLEKGKTDDEIVDTSGRITRKTIDAAMLANVRTERPEAK